MTTLEQHLAEHPVTVDDLGRRCACDPDAVRYDGPYPEDEALFYELHAAHVAATWREARTVRTDEELDALPIGAVVHTTVSEYRRVIDGGEFDTEEGWVPIGESIAFSHDCIDLPALVLWAPEDDEVQP